MIKSTHDIYIERLEDAHAPEEVFMDLVSAYEDLSRDGGASPITSIRVRPNGSAEITFEDDVPVVTLANLSAVVEYLCAEIDYAVQELGFPQSF